MKTNRAPVIVVGLIVAACAAPPAPSRPVATSSPAESPVALPDPSTPSVASPSPSAEAEPSVWVESDLTPRMTPEAVAARVMKNLLTMERMASVVVNRPRIVSIRALRRGEGIEWEVRAEGTFVVTRPGTALRPPPPVGSGYFIIADGDGSIVGYGLP